MCCCYVLAFTCEREAALILMNTNHHTTRYDVVMLVLLIYVALAAPFQVAFVPKATFDVFFVFDRFVDLFFLFDLGFNFFRPQMSDNSARDLKVIRAAYTKGVGPWPLPSQFCWDFISTIPYDLLSPIIEEQMKGSGFGHLKVIRMIRLMRLLKLAKIIRKNRCVTYAGRPRTVWDVYVLLPPPLPILHSSVLECATVACSSFTRTSSR